MLENRAKDALLVAVFNAVLVVVDLTRHLELWVTVMNALTVVASIIMYFVFRRVKPLRTWAEERFDVLLLLERERKIAPSEDWARGIVVISTLIRSGSHEARKK